MEYHNISFDGKELHIDGVPDATRVVEIKNDKAQQLADLALHLTDLEIAFQALQGLDVLIERNARESLWRSAIIHYVKCFSGGHESRFKTLRINTIVDDQKGRDAHKYFDTLRNRHIVHDANAFLQGQVLGLLNENVSPWKVEKITVVSAAVETLNPKNVNNLSNLIAAARDWINKTFDELCANITEDLSKLTQEEMQVLPAATLTTPAEKDIQAARPQVRTRQPRKNK